MSRNSLGVEDDAGMLNLRVPSMSCLRFKRPLLKIKRNQGTRIMFL